MSDQESLESEADDGNEDGGSEEGGGVGDRRGVEELVGLLDERLAAGKTDGIEQAAAALAAETRRGIALTSSEAKRLEVMLSTSGANAIPTNVWLDLDSARRTR